MPVLLLGLGFSLLPKARQHWQPVMASFIVTVALCLMLILLRIDQEGGAGLKSWVGVLNFTFLEFYCFVILGVQFRHALASGALIMAAFLYALWWHAGLSAQEAGYWSYHVLTVFILAAGIGWWREYLLRKEFMARAALDDSLRAAEQRALRLAHYDEVTGLPNRRLFAELAAPALERARRSAAGCAVLHVEIDRFGGVHELYGHGQGELVLATIARRLRACLRGSSELAAAPVMDHEPSLLARLGDQAFAIPDPRSRGSGARLGDRAKTARGGRAAGGARPPGAALVGQHRHRDVSRRRRGPDPSEPLLGTDGTCRRGGRRRAAQVLRRSAQCPRQETCAAGGRAAPGPAGGAAAFALPAQGGRAQRRPGWRRGLAALAAPGARPAAAAAISSLWRKKAA